jgi:hypothetical protein
MPLEMLEQLFLDIDNPSDLFNLHLVCKQWHVIITNERFEIPFRQTLKWVIYCSG